MLSLYRAKVFMFATQESSLKENNSLFLGNFSLHPNNRNITKYSAAFT